MPRCQDCQAEIVGDGNAYRSSSVSMEKPEKVSIGAHFKYQLGKMRTNLPSQGKVLISIGIIGLVGGGFSCSHTSSGASSSAFLVSVVHSWSLSTSHIGLVYS